MIIIIMALFNLQYIQGSQKNSIKHCLTVLYQIIIGDSILQTGHLADNACNSWLVWQQISQHQNHYRDCLWHRGFVQAINYLNNIRFSFCVFETLFGRENVQLVGAFIKTNELDRYIDRCYNKLWLSVLDVEYKDIYSLFLKSIVFICKLQVFFSNSKF